MPGSLRPGDVVLEDYRVERLLGLGGMGRVYLLRSATTGTRFAVKQTFIREPAAQRRFLAELLTWFNLPKYPHFTACHFFRTIAGEIAIFAEFVPGGSLDSWIGAGRLAETQQILDVSIQTAWALHALHESKLIHRDVKPRNILMDLDGTAKLTDFGLSKARPAGAAGGPGPGRLTAPAGTFEYCSPEQLRGAPAGAASDVWSWGLSVLEMFKGSVTWSAGFMAPEVLAAHVRNQQPRGGESPVPPALVEILDRCFREQTEARWQNMAEVAGLLMDIYHAETGREYPRRPPHPLAPKAPEFASHDRQSLIGVAWDDPEPWLREALKLDGRDPAEAEAILLERKGTRKAQAIADLAAFEETERILAGLVDRGADHLKRSLANLLAEKALVHINVDDVPGAHALLDRAAAVSSQLNSLGDRADSVRASLNKALLFEQTGQYGRAKELYEILIPRMEAIVKESAAPDLVNDLAKLYHNLANTLDELDQKTDAIELNGKAIEIRTALVERHPNFIRDLAMTQASQAALYCASGQAQKAFDDFELALATYRRITDEEALSGPVYELAAAMLNQASAATELNRDAEAARLCDKAVSLLERLVRERGAVEAEPALGRAYFNRMVAYRLMAPRLAYEAVESAIRILHRLVTQEGRAELGPDLERAYAEKGRMVLAFEAASGGGVIEPAGHDPAAEIRNQAMALERAGDLSGAMALCDAAIRTYLAARTESPSAFEGELAVTRINKAAAAAAAGEDHDAVLLCDEAIAALSALAKKSGLAGVIDYLEAAYTIKAQAAARREDTREELSNYSKQVELLSRVAIEDNRWQCRFHLARAWRNLAIAEARGGDVERAAAACAEGSAILSGIREKAAAPAVSDELAEVRSIGKELKRRAQCSFAKQLRAKLESWWRRWRWPATRSAPSKES